MGILSRITARAKALALRAKGLYRTPKTPLGQFLFFGLAEFLSFFIIVMNTRAVAQGSYLWTAITDSVFTLQGFALGKMMMDDANARTWYVGMGVVVGGTSGSLFSIFITKMLYGQ